MAHSSGGGSSGGGCHSGSSHSSSGSRTHCHTSPHHFSGARRYVYTDRNGKTQYVYSSHHPARRQPLPWLLYVLLFLLSANIFRDPGCRFFRPEKLSNPCSDIVIEDRQNVIRAEESLRRHLAAFYEETGVTPAVVTVSPEQWQKTHYSLMDYALGQYYALFEDEAHWLIVFSMETDTSGKPLADQWAFEGIIGDDTGISISESMCEMFTEQTHRYLKTLPDPGEVIGWSFEVLRHQRMHKPLSYNSSALAACTLSAAIIVLPIIREIMGFVQRRKYRDAVLDH